MHKNHIKLQKYLKNMVFSIHNQMNFTFFNFIFVLFFLSFYIFIWPHHIPRKRRPRVRRRREAEARQSPLSTSSNSPPWWTPCTRRNLTSSAASFRTPTSSLAGWNLHWSCISSPATGCWKESESACEVSPTGGFLSIIILSRCSVFIESRNKTFEL